MTVETLMWEIITPYLPLEEDEEEWVQDEMHDIQESLENLGVAHKEVNIPSLICRLQQHLK